MHSRIKAKKMKKSEGGTVIVLTLAGLAAILGVIGLAIDLGLMFDYKQRAQMAADAGALAAALSPTVYEEAARDMAKENGFEHNRGSIIVSAVTPPATGEHTGSANKDKYYEVTVKEEYPTYFLKMIGIKSFPIAVSAVAGIDGTGNCMVTGAATTENNLKFTAPQCNLYFSSLDDQGNIEAAKINIAQANPPAPGTFPSFPSPCDKVGKCKNSTLTPGCYDKITVEGKNCLFDYGAFYIKGSLKFETDGEATNNTSSAGYGVTFFLGENSSFDFNGKATFTSGSDSNFKNVLLWSKDEGSDFQFGPNSKADLTGLVYAPEVEPNFAGKINLYVPSGGSGGASSKVLLVE